MKQVTNLKKFEAIFVSSSLTSICKRFTATSAHYLYVLHAGIETTTQSMRALIAILANNPEIQEKIHKEIGSVIGQNEPRLEDRQKMHYTSAVLDITFPCYAIYN